MPTRVGSENRGGELTFLVQAADVIVRFALKPNSMARTPNLRSSGLRIPTHGFRMQLVLSG